MSCQRPSPTNTRPPMRLQANRWEPATSGGVTTGCNVRRWSSCSYGQAIPPEGSFFSSTTPKGSTVCPQKCQRADAKLREGRPTIVPRGRALQGAALSSERLQPP